MVRARTPNAVGAPAAKYPNRTDLAAKTASGMPAQPIRTPTGQAYGEATALANSQALAPLPQTAPVPDAPPGPGPNLIPGTTTPQAAIGYTPPDFALSSTPSRNPNEPLTAGLPVGAGAGPNPTTSRQFGAGAMLAALAAATGDQNLAALADTADAQGF